MKIPLLDLNCQHLPIKDEIISAIEEILLSGNFILGPKVKEFEAKIAEYCGAKYGIGVASGTDALHLALRALEIGPGDGVVVPTYTFFATAEAVSLVGARPFFIDIDPDTYNLNINNLEIFLIKQCEKGIHFTRHKYTNVNIRAVIPVHLFGQCAQMKEILELAKDYKLSVIEDCAQSIGASQLINGRWVKSGNFGDIGCFSFFPSKNLSALGDGGMVVTNDDNLAERLRILRVHGANPKYFHHFIGINSRLDEIQAAVLLVKFKYLEDWTQKRISNALFYTKNLKDVVKTPLVLPQNISVYNQYVIRTPFREDLRKHLTEKGIGTEIYYPLPLHLQKCYKQLGYKMNDFPNSEICARESLAIPIYPGLTELELTFIVESIIDYFTHKNKNNI